MNAGTKLYGCVEAGGTKFVCGLADEEGRWLCRLRIPTQEPAITLAEVVSFLLASEESHGRITSLGVASFGPISLNRSRPDWGRLLSTPKPKWSGVSIVGPLLEAFDLPLEIDTDVNAAALAEVGATPDLDPSALVYVTVGTGIGGGAVVGGKSLIGARHSEMGHLVPPRHRLDQDFPGCCPYHGACLEGLASGPAITAQWGRSLSELDSAHPAHDIVAWYLGWLASSLLATLSPARIVFGGGVMGTRGLLDGVRRCADRMAGGYIVAPGEALTLIHPPMLGDDAGLFGALALARMAAKSLDRQDTLRRMRG
ncbi:ROK family protein [Sphingomonas sp. TX0543]|uniref:ROK family protein n=1 Tax=unclassified Sphingomonas TaxID=196159 RepID=UPI0010F81AC6|nr:ROK family protein [Sphingomonas sp. 3P27F8]